MLAPDRRPQIENAISLLQGKYIDASFDKQLLDLTYALESATDTLLLASSVVIGDSTRDIAERLRNDQSKFAAKTLLDVSKLEFDPSLNIWVYIADIAGQLNSMRQGLFRGPLSPFNISDPDSPLREDVVVFHERLKEFGLTVRSWKLISDIS